MLSYLAQEPKDHKASEAASGQAERDELDGMSGGWVRPGSHFAMMGGGLKCCTEKILMRVESAGRMRNTAGRCVRL